ncbi:hypothetical protein BJY04DRAFT_216241 [Aspergillus karnatakaensis]|uniref:DUF3716 domain-containing protein n=1 Tax=Aspergillus karnatakaensis TaxID=1810916 RepID=UPI003CCD13C7
MDHDRAVVADTSSNKLYKPLRTNLPIQWGDDDDCDDDEIFTPRRRRRATETSPDLTSVLEDVDTKPPRIQAQDHGLPDPGGRSLGTRDSETDVQVDSSPDYQSHPLSTTAEIQGQPPPTEVLPGLSSDDYPIPRTVTAGANALAKYLQTLPTLRKLDWREDTTGRPQRKNLDGHHTYPAALIQITGNVAETPCRRCSEEYGLWKTCVLPNLAGYKGDRLGRKPRAGTICANCRSTGHWKCSLRSDPDTVITEQNGPEPAETRGVQKRRRGRKRLLRGRNQIARRISATVNYSSNSRDEEEPTVEAIEKRPPVAATSHRSSERVIPFPLSPGDYNNLPFLKQVLSEQQKHVDAVRRRIEQLEQQERERMMDNPWEILL